MCQQNTGQNYSRKIADASFEISQNIDIWERHKLKFNAKKIKRYLNSVNAYKHLVQHILCSRLL